MMQADKLPNFSPVSNPLLLRLTGPGIHIVGPDLAGLETAFNITGRFIVSQEDFERMDRVPHRHLVLTVLRKSLYGSMHPFKNYVIFQDDVAKIGDAYSGWFSLDVWAYSKFRYEGIYYIRVSLGDALSNVVKAVCHPQPGSDAMHSYFPGIISG